MHRFTFGISETCAMYCVYRSFPPPILIFDCVAVVLFIPSEYEIRTSLSRSFDAPSRSEPKSDTNRRARRDTAENFVWLARAFVCVFVQHEHRTSWMYECYKFAEEEKKRGRTVSQENFPIL